MAVDAQRDLRVAFNAAREIEQRILRDREFGLPALASGHRTGRVEDQQHTTWRHRHTRDFAVVAGLCIG